METQSLQLPDNREDAVLMLAKRAAVGRCLRLEKAAVGGDALRRVFEWIKEHPAAGYSMLGAVGGAGMGGLLNLGRKEEERTPLASMATGALAGGGLGLGAGLLSGNPVVQQMISKLPSAGDVAGKFSQGYQDFKNTFKSKETPPVAASGGSAPGGSAPGEGPAEDILPKLTSAQQEQVLIDYGEANGRFTRAQYENADAAGQGLLVQDVKDYARSQAMSPGAAIGHAAVQNSPLAAAGGGLLGAGKAIQGYRAAGPQFMEGLSTKEVQDALKAQGRSWVGGELMNTPRSQQGSLGRAGAWYNPKGRYVSPAITVPHPNPPATPPGQLPKNYDANMSRPFVDEIRRHGAKSLATTAAATAPKGLIMRNLKPGRIFGGVTGAALLGKTWLDANKIHSEDIAKQFTSGGGG